MMRPASSLRPASLGIYAWGIHGLVSVLLLASCGYIADPLPPSAQIPQAVGDLTAVQRGDKIVLHFTLPRTNTDGLLIKEFDLVQAEIGPDITPFTIAAWAAGSKATPIDVSGEDQTSSIIRELDATPWAGKEVAITVRSSARKNRWSPFSNVVHLSVAEPLLAPKIEVKATGKGYVISWTPQREGLKWRILRRIPGVQKEPIEVGTTEAPPFLDASSQFDIPYEYTVVAIGTASSESPPSEPVLINKPDTFAPDVPGSIAALAGAGTVEVTWERSQEPDLKGYLLFRAVGDGPFQQLGDLLTTPAYSDHDVQPGKRYRYSVAAVDLKGNTSDRSRIAGIEVQ